MWGVLAGVLWLVRTGDGQTRRTPWLSLVIGIVAARLSFVLWHWDAYRPAPATTVYIWQGGFDPVSGIIAVATVLATGMESLREAAASKFLLAVATGPGWTAHHPATLEP